MDSKHIRKSKDVKKKSNPFQRLTPLSEAPMRGQGKLRQLRDASSLLLKIRKYLNIKKSKLKSKSKTRSKKVTGVDIQLELSLYGVKDKTANDLRRPLNKKDKKLASRLPPDFFASAKEGAVQSLLKGVEDGDRFMKVEAIRLLSRHMDVKEIEEKMEFLATDGDSWLRGIARSSIKRYSAIKWLETSILPLVDEKKWDDLAMERWEDHPLFYTACSLYGRHPYDWTSVLRRLGLEMKGLSLFRKKDPNILQTPVKKSKKPTSYRHIKD